MRLQPSSAPATQAGKHGQPSGSRRASSSAAARPPGHTPPRGTSLSRFAYDTLRADIQARRVLPGQRMREIDIAAQLGISRTPVREALKKLAAEGLLEQHAARGFVVTEISTDRVLQLYAMREMLEGAAARFAAEQASPLEIQSLRQILAQLATTQSPAAAAACNRRLHEAIAQAAHNMYLLQASGVLRDALDLLGTTTYTMPGRIASGYAENTEIVERIAARDADGAEHAARRHIQSASSLRLKMLFGGDAAQAAQAGDAEAAAKGKALQAPARRQRQRRTRIIEGD